jgi:ATP-dependent RNA helicase RhlE
MNFDKLGLSDSLLKAVKVTGYTKPTLIQEKAIPAILSGKDVMAAAQTGTGKTAGFTLPLLQLLNWRKNPTPYEVRALVLTPTRELAAQVKESIEKYGANEKLKYGVVFGGVNINPQKQKLKNGLDILIATPGRLLDLHQQQSVKFNEIEVLILDEADRMLDMGFIKDIRRILKLMPKQRQNLMFSATFSNEIRQLAKTICQKPIEIDVAPRNSTVKLISQKLFKVEKTRKTDLLCALISSTSEQALVFIRTKYGANNLVKKLHRNNISALAIHGNRSQAQRTKALDMFKNDEVQVLVATDIAARGIDIDQLPTVINFDLPQVPEDYVHRIGRTGRAGTSGNAISLVSEEEKKQLRDIERVIKKPIPEADIAEFHSLLSSLQEKRRSPVDLPKSELQQREGKVKPKRRRRRRGNSNRSSKIQKSKNSSSSNKRASIGGVSAG